MLDVSRMEKLLDSAPCKMAAVSGYGFAIASPKGEEVPFGRQRGLLDLLKRRYEFAARETDFGQNSTTLVILKRRDGAAEAGK